MSDPLGTIEYDQELSEITDFRVKHMDSWKYYQLRNPLKIVTGWYGATNFHFAAYPALGSAGIGRSRAEAIEDFYETFDFQYRSLVEDNPETMLPSTQAVADLFKSVVLRVWYSA